MSKVGGIMANIRYISTSFWEDSKVQDRSTPEDRYFMLYLLTNPHTNQIGCYEITLRTISYETGYNNETITKLLNRLEKELDFIIYDQETSEIIINNWYKWNWTKSPKVKAYILKEKQKVKSEKLNEILEKHIGYVYGIDTLSGNKIKENKIKENKIKRNNKEKLGISEEDIYKSVENEFGRPISPIEYEIIAQMISDYSCEFINRALREAVANKALSLKYIQKILLTWKQNNLKTISDVEEYIKSYSKNNEQQETRGYYREL